MVPQLQSILYYISLQQECNYEKFLDRAVLTTQLQYRHDFSEPGSYLAVLVAGH